MNNEDDSAPQSKAWVMAAIGILLWVSVKTVTFINRHGLGGNGVVTNHDQPPQPPIIANYQTRKGETKGGVPKTALVPLSSPNWKPDENRNEDDAVSHDESNTSDGEPTEQPKAESPKVVVETDIGPSSATVDRPAQAIRHDSSVRYGFKPSTELVYDFDIRAELGTEEFAYRGRNALEATGKREPIAVAVDQTSQSTGTGFIVHPDGVAVTCAHVVMGATEIVAIVDGVERSATVVRLDEANDLAVLRLDKGRYPCLQFASSDDVRLGQEARAIGYPLTDVLGESIKVTRGEVSGRGGPMGTDGIQIDATINPGNSGGPLVDNSGRVIGITSSMLDGVGVSEVGFAVPSNRAIELAEELDVAVEVVEKPSEMSTPEVIDLVSPATVLLKITSGPQGVGIDPPHEVRFSGYCYATSSPTSSPRSSPMGLRYRSSSRHDEHFHGTMQVDSSGQWLNGVSETTLPFALGKASLVGIEPLPRSAPGRSVSNSVIVIQDWKTEQDNFSTDPYGLGSFASRRRPPWMRLPTPAIKKAKELIGKESTTVALGPPSPNGVEVTTTYSVRFDDDANEPAPIAITGSGKGKFDLARGRMLSMNYKMTVTVNQANVTVRIPIAMNYKLLSSADLASREHQLTRLICIW